MRVLVTGACGMLGTEVSRALEGKCELLRTDVLPGCETLDVADTGAALDTVNRARPDLVIHCAAMTDVDCCERDPDRAHLVNAIGTWNLACACAATDCAIAYVSTDYVFDGEKGAPYTEFDTPNPLGAYGASKLAGETAIREICPRHYIVRTSWLFAPHGKNFALTILNAAQTRKELRVVADQVGCPTYAKDLAAFLATLVGSPLHGTYHFTNAGSCSWHQFAEKIVRTAGLADVNVVPIATEDWPTPTRRPRFSVLRHYRMELLGKDEARGWEEAVAEFVSAWTTARH